MEEKSRPWVSGTMSTTSTVLRPHTCTRVVLAAGLIYTVVQGWFSVLCLDCCIFFLSELDFNSEFIEQCFKVL